MCASLRALALLGPFTMLLTQLGCGTEPPARLPEPSKTVESKQVPQTDTPPAKSPPEATSSPAASRPTRFPAAARVVAVGDVHGDLDATRRVLRLAGLIDADDHWIGGRTVLVQTGDQLDRGDDEQAILDLFTSLEKEAAEAGGAVHVLNGNHELMNAAGDFRYVTQGGMSDFADAPGVDVTASGLDRVPAPMRARAAAFLPGGAYAKILATRNTAVVVGDSVFVHGGVLPKYADKLEALNEAGRAWLAGTGELPQDLLAQDGLVWTRAYSEPEPTTEACVALKKALTTLKASRMVVGHTVQKAGITSACGGAVWRIDVGMAKHYGGQPAALEIRGDEVRPLTEAG
ncbi:MAG: shewanella-like protein phosphatase [Myxococcota bacterium]